MQLLQERGEIASEHGTTTFAILLMQDMTVVPLLALVPLLSTTAPLSAEISAWEQALVLAGMFGLLVGFGRYLLPVGAIARSPLLFAQHTAVLVLLKLVILLGLVFAFGFSRTVAIRVAFYLAQGGEFGFVLFGSAQVLGVIDQDTFILAVGVISVTMLLTPFLVRAGERLSRHSDDHNADWLVQPASTAGESPRKPVVIGGYGRVGHTVATLLHASGVPVVVFDTNPVRVAQV